MLIHGSVLFFFCQRTKVEEASTALALSAKDKRGLSTKPFSSKCHESRDRRGPRSIDLTLIQRLTCNKQGQPGEAYCSIQGVPTFLKGVCLFLNPKHLFEPLLHLSFATNGLIVNHKTGAAPRKTHTTATPHKNVSERPSLAASALPRPYASDARVLPVRLPNDFSRKLKRKSRIKPQCSHTKSNIRLPASQGTHSFRWLAYPKNILRTTYSTF